MHVIRPESERELRQALRLLMSRPNLPADEVEQQIDTLFAYAENRRLSLRHCLAARDSGQLVASCLCVDAPGRVSSVFIPAILPSGPSQQVVVELLREAARLARERDVQLLQALLDPEAHHEARTFRDAGFKRLTELIYLESDLTQPIFTGRQVPQVIWETYTAETHDLFAQVVLSTYEGSLDCGSLNGVRNIEDILASHRATGEFNPRCWLLATAGAQPVGVALLAYVTERCACEVVYMGIVPAWRGQGYGSALLRHAIEVARDQAALALTLTVDGGNTPARKLYQSFGFRETARRHVWMRLWSESDAS